MATARRAYTSEYQIRADYVRTGLAPDLQPERVRRTRQRPEVRTRQPERAPALTPSALRTLIMAVVMIGILFIGMVVVNAQAAKLQYSINQLRSRNNLLENEVNMLNIKIERETGIESLEEYAVEELGMFYPQGEQCLHVSSLGEIEGSLSQKIKEKAYE